MLGRFGLPASSRLAGWLRLSVLALGVTCSPVTLIPVVSAQSTQGSDLDALRARAEQSYTVLPLQDGLALAPRTPGSIRSIEIRQGVIAVDGAEVTGAELRQRLGPETDLVLQLSYLDAASSRALVGTSQPGRESALEQPSPSSTSPTQSVTRRRGALVRFGSDVAVAADEVVTEDVVVIGGSADIDGQVEGDVVVVGGSARLGPRAHVQRDLTVVGGSLTRDPGATVGGDVNEVGLGGFGSGRFGPRMRRPGGFFGDGWPLRGFTPLLRLGGTLVRLMLLILLASVVVLVARTPVERVAERAAAEPFKSWLVGFVAELAVVPVLLVTVVGLAVSIVGIPLLPLVPLAIIGLILVLLVGFSGVAQWLGRQVQTGLGWSRSQPVAATVLGIGLLVLPLVLGRAIGLIGGLGAIATTFVIGGALIEYVAWTVGLGAAALVRFGAPLPAGSAGVQDSNVAAPPPADPSAA